MNTDKDYNALADWAEHDMTLPRNSSTALRGADAAEAGRALLERAGAGRPALDPTTARGSESPKRQVRLPRPLSEQLDRIAAQQHRRPSAVMRDAVAEYIAAHSSEDRAAG